jgi:hypothetical protein
VTDATHDVEGVLLPRPFKITKIGPAGLFVNDLAASEAFYRDVMGFVTTEVVDWQGHRCVFMRHGNEHHSLKLYPKAARAALGLSEHTSCVSMGLQVGSYRQLRAAVAWLTDKGARRISLPAELSPASTIARIHRPRRPPFSCSITWSRLLDRHSPQRCPEASDRRAMARKPGAVVGHLRRQT